MTEFKQDDEITPVIFRRWPKREGGTVVAIFPALLGSYAPHTMTCYEHVGQHGQCDGHIMYRTKPTAETDPDVVELRRELEGRPFGYRLKVYRRINRQHRKAREDEARQLEFLRKRTA